MAKRLFRNGSLLRTFVIDIHGKYREITHAEAADSESCVCARYHLVVTESEYQCVYMLETCLESLHSKNLPH